MGANNVGDDKAGSTITPNADPSRDPDDGNSTEMAQRENNGTVLNLYTSAACIFSDVLSKFTVTKFDYSINHWQ